jgi:hypothetical protein
MATNAHPPGPTGVDYSTADELIAALVTNSSVASINWQDPSVALWVKAVLANGFSVGTPGCPSREVADAVLAIYGA